MKVNELELLIEKLTEKIDNIDLIYGGCRFFVYILFGPYVISI